jgi:lipid II isoglutaminyl synthase (glutamine-hydrolysing)
MSSGRAVVLTWAAAAREAVATWMNKAARAYGRPSFRPGSVLVAGSSGKGTTCRMLAQVLRAARLHPVLAADGARPQPDVVRTLASHAGIGRLRSDPRAIGLAQVESAELSDLVRRVSHPAALVCTNILDGQPDDDTAGAAFTARLERAIRSLPTSTTLVLNADDPRVAGLAANLPNPRLYFGMSDPVHGRVRPAPAAEVPCCPRCDGRLSYARVYYGHLGHWACGGCGLSRPEPDVAVTKIGLVGSSSSRLEVVASSAKAHIEVPLPGMCNAYNALAAVTVATHLGLPSWSLRAIENASGGPMRMERTRVAGHDVYLAVAADATGYSEVLRAILGDGEPKRVLLGLSARQWPQQDVSWIWDVDFEALAGLAPAPVVSGNRAADLGVRLKYAGWLGDGRDQRHAASAHIEPDPIRAVLAAIGGPPPGQPLWIVSTPSPLAEIRRWLRHHDHVPDLAAERTGQVRASRRAVVRAAVQLAGPRLAGPRLGGPRLAGTQSPGPQPSGPQPSGPQPSGPQPSGPPRSAPQPPGPPLSRRRPDRGGRRGWSNRHPGQAGAAR